MRDLVGFETRVADRLLHGDVVPGGAAAEKPQRPAIDGMLGVEAGRAVNLTAEPELHIIVGAHDAGFGLAQRREHFLGVAADR